MEDSTALCQLMNIMSKILLRHRQLLWRSFMSEFLKYGAIPESERNWACC